MADSQATSVTYQGLNQNLQASDSPISDKGAVNSFDFANNNDRSAVGLYNLGSINANFIKVGTLTGINLNGGVITGGTIIGALIETSSTNPKVVMNDTFNSLDFYNSAGSLIAYIDASDTYGFEMVSIGTSASIFNTFISSIESVGITADGLIQIASFNDTAFFAGTAGFLSISLDHTTVSSDGYILLQSGSYIKTDTLLANGVADIGDATDYYNEINYKTLTDRGCLGWFDDGVELQDGRKVKDIEAIQAIKKHPTKKTIYGVPMLDYSSLPKVVYKKATDRNGTDLPRDENDNPYVIRPKISDKLDLHGLTKDDKIRKLKEFRNQSPIMEKVIASDGAETTALLSILIGAVKDLDNRLKAAGI